MPFTTLEVFGRMRQSKNFVDNHEKTRIAYLLRRTNIETRKDTPVARIQSFV